MATASRERHFVVSALGPFDLATILEGLAPGDTDALRQGRVFIDGQRAKPSSVVVKQGSHITWVSARAVSVSAPDSDLEILDRANDWAIVSKPAAWSSEPDRSGNLTSLRERVAEKLGTSRVHVVTRLDAGVSGVVLVAMGDVACQRAAKLQQQGKVEKQYLALALGPVENDVEWNQPVGGTKARSFCHPVAHSASIRFSTELASPVSLLRVSAITGRHHQIRVHAASNHHPLLGDRRYGGPTRHVMTNGMVRTVARPMLHAWQIIIHLPDRTWSTSSEVPIDMRQLWHELGEDWPKL